MISISGSPAERLAALKRAIDEEVNSVGAALRHTFMTKIPTAEDIKQTCNTIAMKLMEGEASQIECKLALVDLLDEALHGMYIVNKSKHKSVHFHFTKFVLSFRRDSI